MPTPEMQARQKKREASANRDKPRVGGEYTDRLNAALAAIDAFVGSLVESPDSIAAYNKGKEFAKFASRALPAEERELAEDKSE